MSLSDEKTIELYREMLKIRRFEEKVSELSSEGLIPGFVHLACALEKYVIPDENDIVEAVQEMV